MDAFLIVAIVFFTINVLFIILAIIHSIVYGKGKPIGGTPRLSRASMLLNRQLNPRASIQPQVTIYDLIRVSIGSNPQHEHHPLERKQSNPIRITNSFSG